MRLVAVLTTFNRRNTTLASLACLERAAAEAGLSLDVVLVDDASKDGTAEAVESTYPNFTVIRGPGDMYWNRGMYMGMQLVLQRDCEAILWLNDDTRLDDDALVRLLATARSVQTRLDRPAIVVGSTRSRTGEITYGGSVSAGRLKRLTYRRVWSETEPVECEVMNGNCVWLPIGIARDVGNLDPRFEHAMGDTDYALRARAKGYKVIVVPGTVGTCEANSVAGTFLDKGLGLRARWVAMQSRKGLPWRSWLRFTSRHGGALWPVYFCWPYLRLIAEAAFGRR
jgi:GT2 family glycosyltransferase